MKKYVPIVNCGYMAGEHPSCWNGEKFDTEAECEAWIEEGVENGWFTEDELGGCVYAAETYLDEIEDEPKEEERLYAVLYHSEWEDYTPSSEILGNRVYKNIEDARKAMLDELEYVKANTWDVEDDDDTKETITDDEVTLFNELNCVDYVSIKVIELKAE